MTRSISGIRPSGRIHLGNYLGSILPAIKHDAFVLIAEYHAPDGDADELERQLLNYFDASKIIRQRDSFDAKLYFELLSVVPTGLLNHMPQYKEKEKTALMFTYPVLMAHDIADYDYVIVGDDQKPHIEFAKDTLYRLDRKCPEAIYEGGRIMDLRDPTRKMSKSLPESCLFMDDGLEVIRSKIRKAVTDEQGRRNLENIYLALGFDDPIPELNSDLKDAIYIALQRIAQKNN
jgi:tryptophanyl-tRNA synthetase